LAAILSVILSVSIYPPRSVAVIEQDNRFRIDGTMLEEIDSMASQ